jgi:hypothetical protein
VLGSRLRRLVLFLHDVHGAVKSEEGFSMGAAVGAVKLSGGGNGYNRVAMCERVGFWRYGENLNDVFMIFIGLDANGCGLQ